jgi:outer membrane lipopolysaccharide assembly protein LptE/RlpB
MKQRMLTLSLIAATLALAACGGSDDNNPAAPTARSLAISQINTLTCTTNTPADINGLNIAEDDSAVNVDSLTPACSLPGG